MRVLVALLLVGIAGCGGGDNSPDDVAAPASTAISPVKAEQKATAKKSVEGQETLTLKGHSGPVSSVSFSPDGKRIVSGGSEYQKPGEIKVWDAQTGQETLTLTGHSGSVWSVSFSPDGKRFVSGSLDNTLKVWDISSLDAAK